MKARCADQVGYAVAGANVSAMSTPMFELNFCRTADWTSEPHGREAAGICVAVASRDQSCPLLLALYAPESAVLAGLQAR